MRWLGLFAIFSLTTSAWADQTDPELESLFDALRNGSGDPEQTQLDIEDRWLNAPEISIGLLTQRAVVALGAGDLDTADVLVGHITGLAPSYAEGWVLRGHLAWIADNRVEAQAAYSRVIDLEPRHYIALERLGDLALRSGNRGEAHRRYREALDWNPHLDHVREAADRLRVELGGQEI